LNGCKIWSFILREKHALRALGNRLLRKVFAPKREETKGRWRKFHNEVFFILYS
jgi:hypothetical protein